MITHRLAMANNPHVLRQAQAMYEQSKKEAEENGCDIPDFDPKRYYDPKKPTSFLMYLDANNL